jgi:hypothetical protein
MRFLRRLLRWQLLIALVAVAVIAIIAGISIVSANEQHDEFCISCHTQPESTYYARFQGAVSGPSKDLASFHHKQHYPRGSPEGSNIRCIDCHAGEGLVGRGIVVSLAAWDALKYATRTETQPARVVFTIQNQGCIKCHEQQVKANLDKPAKPFIIDNHYHYMLFGSGAPFEACVACHVSHREGSEINAFQFRDAIIPVCQDCHRMENKGPIKMQ